MSFPNPGVEVPSRRNEPLALRFPAEIVNKICDEAPNSTIKNMCLICRFYLGVALLRLNRVFISTNPRNVEVFKAIAGQKFFPTQIIKIIWDDALLYGGPPVPRDEVEAYYVEDDDDEYEDRVDQDLSDNGIAINWEGNVSAWFRKPCKENIFDLSSLKAMDADRPDHIARAQQVAEHMPMEKAWAYYQDLLEQQREVLNSEAHIRTLEDHIGSFPALRRVTITQATHGRPFKPLYETPMIRAFPRGFNYRTPRGWPVTDRSEPECDEWNDDGNDWQGFRVVTRLLAENKDANRVTYPRIDTNTLETGLNSRVFEKENRTLAHFETVLARPNFRHLHLDLMVDPFSR
ncbi:hypothetical protein AAE478_002637 [Parahypoxylon ruwenzoriense]